MKQRINQQFSGQVNSKHPGQRIKKKREFFKNKEILRNFWYNIKYNNICIIGVPGREENRHEIEKLFEDIVAEYFPNLVKEKVTQVQETQRVPIKIKSKRPTPRHFMIKMPKIKDKHRTFKAARERES